ncbi:MAG: hypothetical protein L0Z70_11340 [Chloroflexi bacterium]|nr:hypothetical protein [Chloroflexota bacterium]
MQTSASSQRIYSRVAGFTFIFYIVAGIASMMLGSESPAVDLLSLLQSFSALILGVTLYALTREQGGVTCKSSLPTPTKKSPPITTA